MPRHPSASMVGRTTTSAFLKLRQVAALAHELYEVVLQYQQPITVVTGDAATSDSPEVDIMFACLFSSQDEGVHHLSWHLRTGSSLVWKQDTPPAIHTRGFKC